MNYFFDAYALVEILINNPEYVRFSQSEIITSSLQLGEVYYFLLRNKGKTAADKWFESFSGELLSFDEVDVINAMNIKFQHKKLKLSMQDCLGYVLAKKHSLFFLTGDNMFKDMPHVEFVK